MAAPHNQHNPHNQQNQTEREDRQRQALAVPTRQRIFDLIAAAPHGAGVAELAAACEVHENTVRQHLAVLIDAGLVADERDRRQPRRRGRPAHRYRAVASPPASSGDAYRRLAGWLAEAVRTGSSALDTGRHIGARELHDQQPASALAAVEKLLSREGFSPETFDNRTGDHVIVLRSCPFAAVAAQDPATICALHLGMVEGLASGDDTFVVDGLTAVSDPTRGGCRLRLKRQQGG